MSSSELTGLRLRRRRVLQAVRWPLRPVSGRCGSAFLAPPPQQASPASGRRFGRACANWASGPAAASGPSVPAFNPSAGRCRPRLSGPSSCRSSRRAACCSCAHSAAGSPAPSTSAARQRMRPAISSAASVRSAGSAMMARSARDAASSARVPLVSTSSHSTGPANAAASGASSAAGGAAKARRRARAAGVVCAASQAKTTMDCGSNSGVR